jgi:23S rRNA (cytosine1962-C5)-methyltransferase
MKGLRNGRRPRRLKKGRPGRRGARYLIILPLSDVLARAARAKNAGDFSTPLLIIRPGNVWLPHQYELVDFGSGRKLERFAARLVDRPSPAAEDTRRKRPREWPKACARFERTSPDRGGWTELAPPPEPWQVAHGGVVLSLKPTPHGHLGVFPEHAATWEWIAGQVARAKTPLRVLHLFAYTGAATLAAAAAGAEVTHVDASKSTVAWARRNAELSCLAEAPIRWIVEDARKFVDRQLRRGRQYDAIVLDPPTYGHGPAGNAWKVARHLPPLLTACAELSAASRAFMLLSCHTPGYGPKELAALLADALGPGSRRRVEAGELSLATLDGRALPAGAAARWSAEA